MEFNTPKLDALITSQESIANSLGNLELVAVIITIGVGVLITLKIFESFKTK